MPFLLYVLGLAVFAQGTSEFMLSGLVPDIARGLDVSIAAAGGLTTAFALGMIAGAPAAAWWAGRWPIRRALLVFLGVFMAVHVAGAVTDDYRVLVGTRVVAAVANAGFLAVSLRAAAGLVAPAARGRAASILLSGATLACAVGVPAGAVLGRVLGWRSAFWAVALLVMVPLVVIARSVPGGAKWTRAEAGEAAEAARPVVAAEPARPTGTAEASAITEFGVLRRPRLLVLLLLGALVNAGTFCAFTYLAPLVTDVAGLAGSWVPGVLALFGLGAFAGVTAAGRLRVPLTAGVALAAGWALLAPVAASPAALLVLVPLLGALSFGVGSTLIIRALHEASDAPRLGGAFATSALNVGAAVGPALGGLAIDHGFGYRAPAGISVLLTGAALAVLAAARRAID